MLCAGSPVADWFGDPDFSHYKDRDRTRFNLDDVLEKKCHEFLHHNFDRLEHMEIN